MMLLLFERYGGGAFEGGGNGHALLVDGQGNVAFEGVTLCHAGSDVKDNRAAVGPIQFGIAGGGYC